MTFSNYPQTRHTSKPQPLTPAQKARNRAINVSRLKAVLQREAIEIDDLNIQHHVDQMTEGRLHDVESAGMFTDMQIQNCTPKATLDAIDRIAARRWKAGDRTVSRLSILREYVAKRRDQQRRR